VAECHKASMGKGWIYYLFRRLGRVGAEEELQK